MNVRETAHKCLCDTMIRKQYASLAMRTLDNVSNEDKGLITQIVYGTLRNWRYVRYQWSRYVSKKPSEEIAILLDMSVFQLFLLDRLPAYAVVDEAVEIAGKQARGAYRSLVNAVLRKLADSGPQKVEADDETAKLAIETSHPDWLIRMWQSHYGEETMKAIAWDDLQEGRTAFRANTFLTSEEELLKDPRISRGETEGALYYDGNILASDYFARDMVIIQSQSSQQVVRVLDPQKGDRILDMCAAPGTKSIQMAMATANSAEITAIDLHEHRVKLIEQAIEKYGARGITVMCCDSRRLPVLLPLHSFDKVLLDAPCSGLGTLKHKPEIKMNLTPQDIDDIVLLQGELLEAAALMVTYGGTLVYSTCTLNRKENEKQCELFLSQHPEFTLESQRTIFPYETGSDGFYIAKMRKSMIE